MIMTGLDNTDLLVNTRESKPMSKCMQGGKGGGGRRRERERGGGRG